METYLKPNRVIASVGVVVFFYSLFLLVRDIGGVYQSTQSLFGYDQSIYSVGMVTLAVLAPASILGLAALAHFNRASWLSLPVALFGWFMLGGYIVTAFIIIFFIWLFWARKNATT